MSKVVFISPCFNAAKNLESLVSSIRSQKNKNWNHIIVDDVSDDDTYDQALVLTEGDKRFEVIKNDEKKFALRNIIDISRRFQGERDTIIAIVDGDDCLCNNNTVDLLTLEYDKGADVVWTDHVWDINGMNVSQDMPNNVDPYFWKWSASHLKTFKANLLADISDDNFKNTNGGWFERGYDQALMLPILYVGKKRSHIGFTCYRYNIESVSVNDRDWAERKQISTINTVRARGFLQ